MQGSAEHIAADDTARQALLATGTGDPSPTLFETASSLREAAAARVAAHRSRRAGAQTPETAREETLRLERTQLERDTRRGASRVRDAVRARYESTQSYRDFLAAEAERAIQQARAEAEIAARNAQAIADAQLQLLEELRQQEDTPVQFREPDAAAQFRHIERSPREKWAESKAPDAGRVSSATSNRFNHEPQPTPGDLFADPFADAPTTEISTGGLTVRLYDDLAPMVAAPRAAFSRHAHGEDAFFELEELEQEIAFRRAPEFIDHIIETLPIPANLIEFPRELVAARKARPRLAEGPLRDELAPEPQLRIFEVEPETISTEPASEELAADAPVWQGLMLDTPRWATMVREAPVSSLLPDIAPISRRLMAATVDACCVGASLVAFATTVSYISGPRLQALSRPMLAGGAFFTLAIATLLYQVLFFSLNEATPGMRYARIGLCTFAEASPSRRAMRRRVLATVLAACPLGLGLLWAWLDDDRLGWHDRISRMYHRAY